MILSIDQIKKAFPDKVIKMGNIKKTDLFNDVGKMDWLVGDWVVIFEHDQLLRKDMDLYIQSLVLGSYDKWPIKVKIKDKIFNLIGFIDYLNPNDIMKRLLKIYNSEETFRKYKDPDFNMWRIRKNEELTILEEVPELKKNIVLKKIKSKKF